MDSYNGTDSILNFRASQVLTDIPNGTYTVKVATRANAAGAFVFALGEAIADTLVNDSTVMLQVANSNATKWIEIEHHGDSLGGIWQTENEKWQAAQAYDDAIYNANNGKGFGWTWATIDDVVVTNHEMVLGVTTDSTVSKVVFQGKWFSVDDWSLTLKEAGDNSNWTIESGIENVMISLGSKGALLVCADGAFIAHPPKIKAISTIGAGDSSIGGFLAAAAAGKGSAEMIKTAVSYGSAACMSAGTRPPVPADVERVYREVTVETL
jgi:hypothetical protein